GVIATTTSLRIAFSGAGTSESSPMDGPGQWYFFEKVTGDGGGPTHPRPPCQKPGGPARDPNAGGPQHLVITFGETDVGGLWTFGQGLHVSFNAVRPPSFHLCETKARFAVEIRPLSCTNANNSCGSASP